jgi:hypothetical protein
VSQVLGFGWGPGSGQRLLAPGLPDVLLTDGAHLGWLARDGVYALIEDQVHLVAVPQPAGISVSPSCWVVVHPVDGGWDVTRFAPRNPQPESWHFPVRGVLAGAAWAVLDHGFQREVINLSSGEAIRVPVGALDAQPQPFPDGPGLLWVVDSMVYRLRSGAGVRSAGTLPARPDSWRAGPRGAAAFQVGEDLWCMGPSRQPIHLAGLAWEGLRFAPSGDRVLGHTASGIAECCLNTGEVLWEISGRMQPVGFSPEPVFLEERTGRVRDAEGLVLAEGFNPSAAVRDGDRLYGPGGTAWNLRTGERLWPHAPLAAEHLAVIGDRLVAIGEDLRLFDLAGEPCGQAPLPIDTETEGWPVDVYPTGSGSLCVELEEGALELSLDGQRRHLAAPTPPPPPPTDLVWSEPDEPARLSLVDPSGKVTQTWPIASDGAARVGDRVWSWTEDGMLCALDAAPSSEGQECPSGTGPEA